MMMMWHPSLSCPTGVTPTDSRSTTSHDTVNKRILLFLASGQKPLVSIKNSRLKKRITAPPPSFVNRPSQPPARADDPAATPKCPLSSSDKSARPHAFSRVLFLLALVVRGGASPLRGAKHHQFKMTR